MGRMMKDSGKNSRDSTITGLDMLHISQKTGKAVSHTEDK